MPHRTGLESLSLSHVAGRCASETERYFARQRHDPLPCFELFRRAIRGHDQLAWQHVYTQYHPLVSGWVRRHSGFASTGEEVQYFVNRAFEKMWLALNPDRFDQFPNLKSLLRYLQMCVHSTILDVLRAREAPVQDLPAEALAPGQRSAAQGERAAVEQTALGQVHRQEFWSEISARLHNEQERRVVYGSFVLGMKPREVHEHYPGTFRSVKHVYRVKENVLARLRRDSTLKLLFG